MAIKYFQDTHQSAIIYYVLLIVAFLPFGCAKKEPLVKPESNSAKGEKVSSENNMDNIDKNPVTSKEYLDAKKQYTRFWSHIFLIEIACELYHDTYLTLPDDLSDLLDGFMLIWPGNIYQGGPVKILNSIPDPENPNHRGNVYYELLDGHEATLKFVIPDLKNFTPGREKWILSEQRIVSDTAKLLLNPQEEKLKPSSAVSQFLLEATKEERYRYGYVKLMSQSLSYLIDDSLMRKGILEDTLVNLVDKGNYYFIDTGIQTISKNVVDKKITFNFGTFQDPSHAFLDCRFPADDHHPMCRRYNPSKGLSGEVEYLRECPIMTTDSTRILFSPDSIINLTIPDEIILSKEDVIIK
jgi:hypothetical protein